MTIPNFSSHTDKNHDVLETLTKIQFHHNILNLTNFKVLISFHFKKIELENECDPKPQLCDSVSIFESMLTLVSLPDLDPIPEPTLIFIPINLEHGSLILDTHISVLGKEC